MPVRVVIECRTEIKQVHTSKNRKNGHDVVIMWNYKKTVRKQQQDQLRKYIK